MDKRRSTLKDFKPGRGYSRKEWDDVSNNPELTGEELSNMKPFAEVLPDLAASIKRSRGRPPLERPKQQISLRLDQDVIDKWKASGPGWQKRINEILRKAKA